MADPALQDTRQDLNYKARMSIGRWEEALAIAETGAKVDDETITLHKSLIRLAKGMLTSLDEKMKKIT